MSGIEQTRSIGSDHYQMGEVRVTARIDVDLTNRDLGTTAIVITHNEAIAGMADRVLYLGE